MSRNFLLYWRPETVEQHLNENYLLNHAGSNQLNRVVASDVLWIVTTGEADEVGLAGRLCVGAVVKSCRSAAAIGKKRFMGVALSRSCCTKNCSQNVRLKFG